MQAAAIQASEIEQTLSQAFPGAQIRVLDTRRDQLHWKVVMRAEAFRHKTPLECHRLVYRALGEEMKGRIHALSLDLKPPS